MSVYLNDKGTVEKNGGVCCIHVRAGDSFTCLENLIDLSDVVQLDVIVESDAYLFAMLSGTERDDLKINIQVHARGFCVLLMALSCCGQSSCAIDMALEHESARAIVRFVALLQCDALFTIKSAHMCAAQLISSDVCIAAFVAPKARAELGVKVDVSAYAHQARLNVQAKALLAGLQARAVVCPQFVVHSSDASFVHGALVARIDVPEIYYLRMYGIHESYACTLLWGCCLLDQIGCLLPYHVYAHVIQRFCEILYQWYRNI